MVFGLFHCGKTGRFPSFLTLDQKCGYSYKMGLQHSGRIRENIPDSPRARHIQQLPTPCQEGKRDTDTTGLSVKSLTTYTLSSKMTQVKRLRGRPLETAPSGLSLTKRLRTKTLSTSKDTLEQFGTSALCLTCSSPGEPAAICLS